MTSINNRVTIKAINEFIDYADGFSSGNVKTNTITKGTVDNKLSLKETNDTAAFLKDLKARADEKLTLIDKIATILRQKGGTGNQTLASLLTDLKDKYSEQKALADKHLNTATEIQNNFFVMASQDRTGSGTGPIDYTTVTKSEVGQARIAMGITDPDGSTDADLGSFSSTNYRQLGLIGLEKLSAETPTSGTLRSISAFLTADHDPNATTPVTGVFKNNTDELSSDELKTQYQQAFDKAKDTASTLSTDNIDNIRRTLALSVISNYSLQFGVADATTDAQKVGRKDMVAALFTGTTPAYDATQAKTFVIGTPKAQDVKDAIDKFNLAGIDLDNAKKLVRDEAGLKAAIGKITGLFNDFPELPSTIGSPAVNVASTLVRALIQRANIFRVIVENYSKLDTNSDKVLKSSEITADANGNLLIP